MSENTINQSEFLIPQQNSREKTPNAVSWQMFKNALIAGTISNMAGTISGHPLDTIRVSLNVDLFDDMKFLY